MIGGRREAGDVGHDAAADGYHGVGPREAGAGEAAGQVLHRGQRLGLLAVGDEADLGGHAEVETADPAGLRDRLLGDDDRRPGAGRQEACHFVARPGPDQHRVRAFGQVDGEGAHVLECSAYSAALEVAAGSASAPPSVTTVCTMRSATASAGSSSTSITRSATSA